MNKKYFLNRLSLVLLGIVGCLVLIELSLQGGEFLFLFFQEHRNEDSLLRSKRTYRIMCVGESTTALGGKNSYPRQLEKVLGRSNLDLKISVINKGIPATNTTAIISELKYNLSEYNPDMVIAMMGLNDDVEYVTTISDRDNNKGYEFLKSLKLFNLLELVMERIEYKFDIVKIIEQNKIGNNISGLENRCKDSKSISRGKNYNMQKDFSYYELGKYYKLSGEFEKAVIMFKKAIKYDPKNYGAYIKIAVCYNELHEMEKIRLILREAISRYPMEPDAYFYLGSFCYFNSGRISKAQEYFIKAKNLGSLDSWLYIQLASTYVKQNKYKDAKKILEEAIKIVPQEKEKLYRMLISLCREGEKLGIMDKYSEQMGKIKSISCKPKARYNYRKLYDILNKKNIKLVVMQYPMRDIENLKNIFKKNSNIIFVANKINFEEAIDKFGYEKIFKDRNGGDFGHCTIKGNRILAENLAKVIIKEIFNKEIE